MQQCTSCESIYNTKVPSATCPTCTQGDYSDYFSSGTLKDMNPNELFVDNAQVSMCPKCLIYLRKLPMSNNNEIITNENCEMEQDPQYNYTRPENCPACGAEMISVKNNS